MSKEKWWVGLSGSKTQIETNNVEVIREAESWEVNIIGIGQEFGQ